MTWSDIVNLSKRNKKCEICYSNFAIWKIETIVDVKCQKQPLRGAVKIFIEMFGKSNFFCTFKIFHWYLITDLKISKDFSLSSLI